MAGDLGESPLEVLDLGADLDLMGPESDAVGLKLLCQEHRIPENAHDGFPD